MRQIPLYDAEPGVSTFEHGVDMDEAIGKIVKGAYDAIRTELARRELSDDAIAENGYCEDVAPTITRGIHELLSGTDWSAFTEVHYDGALRIPQHYFTVLAPTGSENPGPDDIVIDATYRQFLSPDSLGSGAPLFFAGTRASIMDLMRTSSESAAYAALYGTSSYESDASTSMAQDHNLPRR